MTFTKITEFQLWARTPEWLSGRWIKSLEQSLEECNSHDLIGGFTNAFKEASFRQMHHSTVLTTEQIANFARAVADGCTRHIEVTWEARALQSLPGTREIRIHATSPKGEVVIDFDIVKRAVIYIHSDRRRVR